MGFEAAAAKNIKPHAGCVVKVFTAIDYQMCAIYIVTMTQLFRDCLFRLIPLSVWMLHRYVLEERSDEEVWRDVNSVSFTRLEPVGYILDM